ncbi:lysine N(6)-hydroxylase/L-ornithine N(5)-oxygenase family protein [Candidatus Poribacteria bacterium]|nr:lysine N(6)-hydroxylase/L-ornithine N(5)-oxygenase family protein [Candidatus Poribacteria bacterium]
MKTLAHLNIPITIIGGGIHGISIALRLLREIPTASRQIAIVDRHPEPLTQWRLKTERQGMTFLRSPAVHHITSDPLGIVEHAEQHNRLSELAPPYSQPSTTLFWDYCNDALAELKHHHIYHQFEVAKLRWDKGAGKYPFRLISTDYVGFRSSCVILAIGSDDCVNIPPEFTSWQRQYPNRIVHSSKFSVNSQQLSKDTGKIVIVGGGLTAGTLAKSLCEKGHQVVLITRKQLKTEQFDFPPIWLGPKALTEFASETDFQQRYQIIQENRGEGSITPEVMEALKNTANLDIYPATYIRSISSSKHILQINTSRGVISNVSRIILATGYKFNLRRYGFMEELIRQHQIPLVCGFPKLDDNLEFHTIKNLFGSGAVAQLQIGPASSNIAGANLAYERIKEKLQDYFFGHTHLICKIVRN